jgi:membrane protease YdiL (CAAX protease family)
MTSASQIRNGFKAASLCLGLMALAVLFRNAVIGSVFFDLSAPSAFASAPIYQLIANQFAQTLFQIFLVPLVLLVGASALWHQPAQLKDLLICLLVGLVGGVLINIPFHNLLISTFMTPGEATAAPAQEMKRVVALLIAEIAFTCMIVPVAEELVSRGLLFDETEELPRLQIAFWSLLMFSFAHYLTFGLTKVVAVMPMAVLFTWLRFKYGSWKHSAAAHAGINLAATLDGYGLLF